MNSKRWRDTRNAWLTEHPLCQECEKHGHVVAATCVHHIIPVESARTDKACEELAFSQSNLMSLCYKCHADIHKAARSHSRKAHHEREEQRLSQWVERHRPTNPRDDGG